MRAGVTELRNTRKATPGERCSNYVRRMGEATSGERLRNSVRTTDNYSSSNEARRSSETPSGGRVTTASSIIYSIIVFPLTPKYVTLNDPEWPFYVKLFFFKFTVCLFTYMDSTMISVVKAEIIYLLKVTCMHAGTLFKAIEYSKT